MAGTLSTRDKVIQVAERLIQMRGYNGFSFDDIAAEVGVRKPSLYYHFATKGELGAEVVRVYTRKFVSNLKRIEQEHEDARSALAGYVDLFAGTYQVECALCLCGVLGAERNTLPEEIRTEINQFFQLNLEWLSKVIRKGQQAARLSTRHAPEKAAMMLLSSLEGAMIVGRGTASATNVVDIGSMMLTNLTA